MKTSLRYKIVLWMVWVQLAILPIVIVMLNVTDRGVMWRWNLPNWLMVGGYCIGLLALPISRGLEKSKLLKWWLRVDFWVSLIPSILVLPLLFSVGRYYIDAEDGEYVLYHIRGLMAVAPNYKCGKKDGLFIRKISPYSYIGAYEYDNAKIECFRVDTLKGCFYGIQRGAFPTVWCCPIDSAKYRHYAAEITSLIDSLYQSQPLLKPQSYGTFTYPDNFNEVSYKAPFITYTDSVTYHIDCNAGDSLWISFYHNVLTELSYPKDSVTSLSPAAVRRIIANLERR